MTKLSALVILDGFGYRKENQANAIAHARMPFYQSALQKYPHTLLHASGKYVGLPDHVVGNSLAGHTTIGAGRIILQPTTLLLEQIKQGTFFTNRDLLEKFKQLQKSKQSLHLMGLLSDTGNHSHEKVLHALIQLAHDHNIKHIVIHAFLDGRDVPPYSAATYLQRLDDIIKHIPSASLATIQGRSFAMDRTNTSSTISQAFELLTQPHTAQFDSWEDALNYYYTHNISDEFIPPTTLISNSNIQEGDALIFWNTRADRARLLTSLFLESPAHLLWLITGIPYVRSYHTTPFPVSSLVAQQHIPETLLHVLRAHNITVGTFCESEKFAHITYFFNGGHEITNPQDLYVVMPSPKPQDMISHPQLASCDITTMVLCSLNSNARNFYLINYANADMLGHTGNFEATVKSLEILDEQLSILFDEIVIKRQGVLYITGDHGNAEYIDNTRNHPHIGHTHNPVPFLVINHAYQKEQELNLASLSDIAPYILHHMHLPIPSVMQR